MSELLALKKRDKNLYCPNCDRAQEIDWDELDEAIDFMTAMQELDDKLGPG